ncbi:TonB-dependent receptor [Sapientia aquatica]|uniref:TonB-dependent receptor n=1 Tax=Sapientia aquatica TaxID=1549640 RepID=A0A4R5VPU6_9BURK|nr:TonB-dependent receptor [Sapientia aquatica]TDK60458.1 TonB-dependent receptor [Sapientia aquatica]
MTAHYKPSAVGFKNNTHQRSGLPARSPLHHAIKTIFGLPGMSAVALSLIQIGTALANADPQATTYPSAAAVNSTSPDDLQTVVVTARKFKERAQDVPATVEAISGEKLEELHLTNFEDVVQLLPSVSFQSYGPGQSQIYMRGAVDGGDGNPSGSSPTVAVYLDETPVTAIGRNLDLHVYDLDRVEALPGPQSTLFGASSEGGTLRMITHQPVLHTLEGGVDAGGYSTNNGAASGSLESFLNIPLGEDAAVRLVVYDIHDGGFIDNVLGNRNYQLYQGSAAGTATPTSQVSVSNATLVKKDFNTEDTRGGRISFKYRINSDWSFNAGWINQNQKTSGVWSDDVNNPNAKLSAYQVQSFFPNSTDDTYNQEHVGFDGDLGFADLLFTASFSQRKVNTASDYSEYSDFKANPGLSSFIGGASCDYYALATHPCSNLGIYFTTNDHYRRQTDELRLQSKLKGDVQYVAGLYSESLRHDYLEQWIEPGSATGGPDMSLLGPSNLWYETNQSRLDKQWAAFGEVRYKFQPEWTATLGGRYFHETSSLAGYSGYGLFAYSPVVPVNSSVSDNGNTMKANLSYQPDANQNYYALWSQGYRPGGINRVATSVVAQTYKPDQMNNYEAGWKLSLSRKLQFDGAFYMMDWKNMQLSRYESAWGAPLGLTVNLTKARITGFETSLAWRPVRKWNLSAGLDLNNARLSQDLVVGSATAGYSVAPSGTPLPYAPKVKYNLSSRNSYEIAEDFEGYFQMTYAETGKRYNDVFVYQTPTLGTPGPDGRREMDAYGQLNLGTGVMHNAWSADFYVNNALNKRAELARSTAAWDTWTTVNRPRTIGLKISYRF